MTLTELAQELKKTIAFDYMTMHKNWCKNPIILLYVGKPRYSRRGDFGGWCPVLGKSHTICSINVYSVIGGIQLLEYADADGNIDYSKCIVWVENLGR